MRGVLALGGAVLVAAALALALHGSAHSAGSRRARLLASSASVTCSAASDCVQGCALAVAERAKSPRSPTSPCASQAQGACTEYVAARPKPSKRAPSACNAPLDAERNALPGVRELTPERLRKLDREALRRLKPQERGLGATLRALSATGGR